MTFCNIPWGLDSNTLPQTEICHRVSCRVRKLNSRTLGNLATQPLAKFGSVIGIDLSVEACARDGNVAEAGVEKVRVDPSVSMNENAFGGEPLRAVTGDGIAVVEMTMLNGVEFDLAAVVEACRKSTVGMDGLDRREVAIGDAKRFVWGCELNAVAYGELTFDFLIDADTGQSAGIIAGKFLVRFLDHELVCAWIDCDNRRIGSSPDSDGFAAACVANYVVDLVVTCPGAFGTSHVLPLNKDTESMILRG